MPNITYEEYAKVELRVGKVIHSEFVKTKRDLISLSVDLGHTESDMVAGKGLPDEYSPEDLVGRQVIWMANLKPKNVGKLISRGMVVAVGDNQVLGLVFVDSPCKAGARVR